MTLTSRATCLIVAAGIVPGLLTVRAQEVSQQDLQECASKAGAAEKLACYESLTVVSEPEPEPEPAPATAAAPVANDSRSTVPQDLGEEYLDRDEDPDPADPFPLVAVVDEVTQSRSGRLYFHFSNGQVWRQNEPRRFRYPRDAEFEAIISKGMMGDYRLRIGETGPMTRIERVE